MANTLIQFRADEATRLKAAAVCEQIGIDLPTYLKMSLKRLIAQNDLPFIPIAKQYTSPMMEAVRACQKSAEEAGISEMTLDEINAQIDAARYPIYSGNK